MTTERDTTIMEEHHEIAGGRIAEAARDASLSPVPAEPGKPEPYAPADVELAGDALARWCEGMGLPPYMVRPYGAVRPVLEALAAAGRLARSTDPGPAPTTSEEAAELRRLRGVETTLRVFAGRHADLSEFGDVVVTGYLEGFRDGSQKLARCVLSALDGGPAEDPLSVPPGTEPSQ